KGAVLIDADGTPIIVGPGLPFLNALVVEPPAEEDDRFRHLAPEVARGEALDARADVYSLSVLGYELLAGRRYRDGMESDELFSAAMEGRAADVPASLPDPLPPLVALLSQGLAPAREQRFASMEAFKV